MRGDQVISALIGLVGACNNNPRTATTDSVVIKALAVSVLSQGLNDESLSGIIEEIYAEKNAVAPDCTVCACPCGNTSDYDMNRIYEAAPEIRDLKLELLSRCRHLAAHVYHGGDSGEKMEADSTFFYKILSCISYDIEKEQLLELLEETQALEQEINCQNIGAKGKSMQGNVLWRDEEEKDRW